MMPNLMSETKYVRSPANCQPCNEPRSGRRRVAAIAVAICIVLAVVWGEVWAIEYGTELAAQCSPEFTSAFDVECGATTAPIAIIH